ncbi:MAG: DUF4870 domain-containing protein [Anaerolineae bacterium]|nr:DUF4870 domain-containing protein [Anaerolineae bacterium]
MDDEERNTHEETPDAPPSDRAVEGEGEPIPARLRAAVADLAQRASEGERGGEEIVREYEERYHGGARSRLATPDAPIEGVRPPVKVKRAGAAGAVSENERKWAALAHASTLLTALVALASGGLGVLLTMFVPLTIYFSFRKRSEFVAFHALQAFTIQLIGTVGWLPLIVVGTVVGVALLFVSIILIIVLVGIVLAPLVILAYILFVLVSFLLPIGMVIYAVIAAVETWNGHNYRYPYIARWVDSQMHAESWGG